MEANDYRLKLLEAFRESQCIFGRAIRPLGEPETYEQYRKECAEVGSEWYTADEDVMQEEEWKIFKRGCRASNLNIIVFDVVESIARNCLEEDENLYDRLLTLGTTIGQMARITKDRPSGERKYYV